MFDWYSLFFGILWICGLSGLLAVLSYQRWLADRQKRPLRELWYTTTNQKFVTSFTLLFLIGFASYSSQLWETLLWAALIFIYLLHTISIWRPKPT